MAQDDSPADPTSSESGWLFLAAVFAGLGTEIFTVLGVVGGIAVMVGYMAMGFQTDAWWERIYYSSRPLSSGKREVVKALWPAVLGGLAALWLVPGVRRQLDRD
jgi:hypothetical protein